jgi:hypothetical protein
MEDAETLSTEQLQEVSEALKTLKQWPMWRESYDSMGIRDIQYIVEQELRNRIQELAKSLKATVTFESQGG